MEGTHPLMEGGGFNHVSGKYLYLYLHEHYAQYIQSHLYRYESKIQSRFSHIALKNTLTLLSHKNDSPIKTIPNYQI